MKENRITLRSLLVGAFFTALFAGLSVYVYNNTLILFTATQIGVLPYLLLIGMVLLLNPLLRLVRFIRPFTGVELMIVFIMGAVSAGIPQFGLIETVMPMIGSLYSREWNNPQSEWNRHIVPFVNEAYFVSEPGSSKAAADYRNSRMAWLDLDTIHRTAVRLAEQRQRVKTLETALQTLRQAQGTAPTQARRLDLRRAELEYETALTEVGATERAWNGFVAQGCPPHEVVLRDYPARLQAQQETMRAAGERLMALEAGAFRKVEVFRRGLPADMSAYPGILPLKNDDFSTYFGRLRRLKNGREALRLLKETDRLLDRAQPADLAAHGPAMRDNLSRAVAILTPLADATLVDQRVTILEKEIESIQARIHDVDAKLEALNEQRRKAGRQAYRAMEGDIRAVNGELKALEAERQDLNNDRERRRRERLIADRVGEMAASIAALQNRLAVAPPAELQKGIRNLLPRFAAVDMSLQRYFAGEVPWTHWARPLARWGLLIALTYVAMMALNVLMFRQWARNEMITYPLAELPKSLVPSAGEDGQLPPIFRNGLFWVGVAVSGSVLGWNLLCLSQVVPGLTPLDMRNAWTNYVRNTPFAILHGWRFEVFFTMIGLSFLIPKNISFSLWFFYVLYGVELLILYWTGHIAGEGGQNWWYVNNISTAQGQGAMIVFASVVLFKCRRYVLCALRPKTVADLEREERTELRLASVAYIGASLGIILQLWIDMGANLFYSIFFYIMLTLMMVAMIRAVAEGGMLSLQTFVAPTHIIRAFFGLNHANTSVTLFSPVLIYMGALFMDLKVFIAPTMANALKLRDDFRMRRGVFHLAVGLAIVLAVVVSGLTTLMMAYDRGGDNMGSYFYTSWPQGAFNTIASIAKNPPEASLSSAGWMAGGAVATGLVIYLRQFFFWVPHPIGMIMLICTVMRPYWFSVFLGWLANSAITKYGHKNTYQRATGFFIGLIVGELLLVILSAAVSLATGTQIPIDLNRN